MKFVLNLVSLPYLMVIENAAKAIGAIRGSRNAEHKTKDLVLNILSILKAQKEIDYLKSQL